MKWRCVLALGLLLGAALASTLGSGGGVTAAGARAGSHAHAPPLSVRKALRKLDAGLARLSRDVNAGRPGPGSRALRLRIVDLLRRQARVSGTLPRALGTPFAFLHGQLTAIEDALDSASEAAVLSTMGAPVREGLLPARTEARRLARELRPRGGKAAHFARALTKKLEALIARLKVSTTNPVATERDLRELVRLASRVAGALPKVSGAGFARVHLQLRWMEDSLVNTLYTRHAEDTLRFLANAAASAEEIKRAFGLATAAQRSRSWRDRASTGGHASTSSVPEPVSELVKQLDAELEKLRDQVESGEVDPRSDALHQRIRRLAGLKIDLMAQFPDLFGRSFMVMYSELDWLDSSLEMALRDAQADPSLGAAVLHLRLDLLRARDEKDQLEHDLRLRGVPEPLLAKLELLNAKLKSALDRTAAKNVKPADLLEPVSELLALKASVLDEFPSVFGAAFIDVYLNLKWLDEALYGPGYDSTLPRDVLRSLLNAISFKKKLEQVLAKPAPAAPGPGPFSVEVGVIHDHDPPHSDACVTVSTSPQQPGARAKVSLRGHSPGSAATPSEQEVVLDGGGRAQARFLVDGIDTWGVEVEVKTEDGRSAGATATFDNSTPTAEPCR